MASTELQVAALGAGRMGRGIALSFALAGKEVLLVDLKQRNDAAQQQLIDDARHEIRTDLSFLASVGIISDESIDAIMTLVSFADAATASTRLPYYKLIFEGVPEVLDAKRQAFDYCNQFAAKNAIVASTTSTFLVNELAAMLDQPDNFVNAHWLNPAHLMPLVEISRGDKSSEQTVTEIVRILEQVGKVPVVCAASAGYIVPRLQALAMNEAARLVEEGVASAEDVDKAVKYGFGLRFGVLGLLEFIDWGGGDILYYASNYLAKAVDSRYQAPDIVASNMQNNRNGLRDGVGFFDYQDVDADAYRKRRMNDFVRMLDHVDSLPSVDSQFKDS